MGCSRLSPPDVGDDGVRDPTILMETCDDGHEEAVKQAGVRLCRLGR